MREYKDPYAGLPDGAVYWWPAQRTVRPRQGVCTCPIPQPSVRPSGRIRHCWCTRCSKSFSLQAQVDAGRIAYGIKGKHKGKMLWAEQLQKLLDGRVSL